MTVNELRLAAYAADEAYSAELVRVYGKKNAGQMRYCGSEHTDAALIAARTMKHKADAVWHAAACA